MDEKVLDKIDKKLDMIPEIEKQGALNHQALDNLNAEMREHKKLDLLDKTSRAKLDAKISDSLNTCPKHEEIETQTEDLQEIKEAVSDMVSARTAKEKMMRGGLAVAVAIVAIMSLWIAYKEFSNNKAPTQIVREVDLDNNINDKR